MAAPSTFEGFTKESVKFYSELALENTKDWFERHKEVYTNHVIGPARDFVYEMGNKLKTISPGVNADPRVNKSIFRPYRDTRFSKDKTPYKTHLGIFFWEGPRAKMECSGYYFHLEPPMLMLAAGIHCFSKPLLAAYRDSVVDPKHGSHLTKTVAAVSKSPGNVVGGQHYKKTPRGYDPSHPNAGLLLHDGLYVMQEVEIPPEFYSPELVMFCFERFKEFSALHKWLVSMTERVEQ